METDAIFSFDRRHRFSLTRIWDKTKPLVAFCMLNPSVADETKNDPTVARCQKRAMNMGYGGIIIVNIFNLVSTDPKQLYKCKSVKEASTDGNEIAIMLAARNSKTFICAWGKHGSLFGRGNDVLKLLTFNKIKPQALKMNKDGSPAHPLYIGYRVNPRVIKID